MIGILMSGCGGGSDDEVAGPTTKLTLLPTTTTSTTTTVPTTDPPVTEAPTTSTSSPSSAPTDAATSTPAATDGGTADETTTAPPTTEDPVVSALRLGDDGIGAALFSGEPESVIAYLGTFIGPPTADTGWVDPFEISACTGTELRVVSWGSLRLTFGDVSPVVQGSRHFFAYTYGTYAYDGSTATSTDVSPPGLVTDDGIGLGSTLLELEGAYPGLEFNPADEFLPETFVVNDNLRGVVDGLADGSTVIRLIGGQDCADPT